MELNERGARALPRTWQTELAQWVAAASYEKLPGEVTAAALRSIVDVVGVALAGSRTDVGQLLARRLQGRAAAPVATAIGLDFGVDCWDAALLNGTASHALDFDDTSYSLIGHSSAVVLPAALAAAECAGAEVNGKDLVLAFVAGTEVACRLGRSLSPKLFQTGWFTTAVVGVFGAAAAAAKIWRLSPDQIGAATAIAGGQAGGIRANNGSMAKPIQCGMAARSGLVAADLARAGVGAAVDVFQGHDGYLSVHGFERSHTVRPSWQTGDPFELVTPGLAIKRYPCCSAIAAAVDALLALKNDSCADWQGVTMVDCETTALAKQSLPYIYPLTWREAQFSLHYCVAWTLVFGTLDLEAFRETSINNAAVREIMGRVRVTYELEDPSGRSEAASVRLSLRDGRSFQKLVLHALGTTEKPLTDDTISEKFGNCCVRALSPADGEALLDSLWHLPNYSVAEIGRLLRCTKDEDGR